MFGGLNIRKLREMLDTISYNPTLTQGNSSKPEDDQLVITLYRENPTLLLHLKLIVYTVPD